MCERGRDLGSNLKASGSLNTEEDTVKMGGSRPKIKHSTFFLFLVEKLLINFRFLNMQVHNLSILRVKIECEPSKSSR